MQNGTGNHGGRRHGRRLAWLAGLLGLAGLAVAVPWRLRRTPEWTVLAGTEAERQAVCRTVWRKSPRRAAWALSRLLADPSPAVRAPAIDAVALRPDLHPRFAAALHRLAEGDDEHVRATAIEAVFRLEGTLPSGWLPGLRDWLSNADARDRHPELTAVYLAAELERGNPGVVEWVVESIEANPDEDCAAFRAILRHRELLRPFRERLVNGLEGAPGPGRALLLAALTAIDGRMRGDGAAAWRRQDPDPGEAPEEAGAEPMERFTVQAEWAHRVVPNFQIETIEGELGLFLGEGGGGEQFWRRQPYTSLDIGRAYLTFTLARADRYQIWCRAWFSDKCGNNSLLHLDDRWLQWRDAGRDDREDVLRAWHWKCLDPSVPMTAGRHTLRITAGDDGLAYDQVAILPARERFDPGNPPPLQPLYDASLPTAISVTPEWQAQRRGTTQAITVWVRRNTADVQEGTVRCHLPEPFRLEGRSEAAVRFDADSPLAKAVFQVSLPDDAAGSEVTLWVGFRSGGQELAVGSCILGIVHDWYSTGPLDPRHPRAVELRSRRALGPGDLAHGWEPFPAAGCDRWRRLDIEMAYGQAEDKIIFLYTEIEAARAVVCQSFLNIDDSGHVCIDGAHIAGRDEAGVGEGWMHVDTVRLAPGRHSVFAWVYQCAAPDPIGPDAGRHTPNHWVFKWLLREARHQPADAIRSVPVRLGASR